jgi:hypothetical protein
MLVLPGVFFDFLTEIMLLFVISSQIENYIAAQSVFSLNYFCSCCCQHIDSLTHLKSMQESGNLLILSFLPFSRQLILLSLYFLVSGPNRMLMGLHV